jgi:nitric oxide reductase subunit C
MRTSPWWSSESFWRKAAIWVTAGMLVVLIVLTFDTAAKITAGGSQRVPPYAVINRRIYYRHDPRRGYQVPIIGDEAPLFGRTLDEDAAEALIRRGKLTVQSRNCMNCHTILGNGAYYAPDLTKAWLDPGWAAESVRERLMIQFLMDPTTHARTFGTGRRMPQLGISDEEARGVVAYLKWMASIDTNGFPAHFPAIRQEGDQ